MKQATYVTVRRTTCRHHFISQKKYWWILGYQERKKTWSSSWLCSNAGWRIWWTRPKRTSQLLTRLRKGCPDWCRPSIALAQTLRPTLSRKDTFEYGVYNKDSVFFLNFKLFFLFFFKVATATLLTSPKFSTVTIFLTARILYIIMLKLCNDFVVFYFKLKLPTFRIFSVFTVKDYIRNTKILAIKYKNI